MTASTSPARLVTRRGVLVALALAALLPGRPLHAAQPLTLGWKQLVPAGFTREKARRGIVFDASSLYGLRYEAKYFPLVEALDGREVRIPGYALPLEFDGSAVTQFMLVPYAGACIHVPPPPPNQIVLVRFEKGYKSVGLFVPVWVTGRMRTRLGSYALELVDAPCSLESGRISSSGRLNIRFLCKKYCQKTRLSVN